jgi:hypothetical protein
MVYLAIDGVVMVSISLLKKKGLRLWTEFD